MSAVESPNRIHASAIVVPVVAPPFTSNLPAAKGVTSFTRLAVGQYEVTLSSPLSFHEGYPAVGLPPNFQATPGAQVTPTGTVFISVLQVGTGVPVDPPYFNLTVLLFNEGEGIGPVVAVPPIPPPIPSGGPVVGDPNSILFENPAGNGAITDPKLTAGVPDAFSRPQVHDYRKSAPLPGYPTGRGVVHRLGRWQVDGDAGDATSEGFVAYGASPLQPAGADPDATQGAFGFYEPNGFGELAVIPGVNGGNSFYLCGFEDGGANAPFGLDGFIVNDNNAARIFQVKRSNNEIFGRTFMTSGGSVWSSGAQADPNTFVTGSPGDYYLSTTGGAGATLWVKESGVSTNTGWVACSPGAIPGSPNALLFENPGGAGAITDAGLTAAPVDAFGRPIFRDVRTAAGTGAVWKQGAWQTDGDPLPNVTGEGFVIYGPNAQGTGPGPTDGGYARIKSNRFGLANIITGVNGNNLFYYFRADPTSLFLADDTDTKTFEVVRATGAGFFGTVRTGGPAGAVWSSGTTVGGPNGVVVGSPGDLYSSLDPAAVPGTTFWVKESGVATNLGWVAK